MVPLTLKERSYIFSYFGNNRLFVQPMNDLNVTLLSDHISFGFVFKRYRSASSFDQDL